MTAFNLDTSSRRGWGLVGPDDDATEHGHHITEDDIKNLSEKYNIKCQQLLINNRQYRLLSLVQDSATETLFYINGGDGRLYLIDSTVLPDGLVMPLWQECINRNVNLIILDHDHTLPWGWNANYNPNKFLKLYEYFIKNKDKISNADTNLAKVFYHIQDLEIILKQVKEETNTSIWLMGHCSSTVLISIINDKFKDPELFNGMIFLNPFWKQNWEETLDKMSYFLTPVKKPLLVIQHRDDPCKGTSVDIAKKIVSDSSHSLAKYVELSGGTDQGCPHFSMGYHGFRDIEDLLILEITNFIKGLK
jgi:hypothetical protein